MFVFFVEGFTQLPRPDFKRTDFFHTFSRDFLATQRRARRKLKIEQKGMTLDCDYGYSLPLFSSLIKKEGRRKG